jgi:hypothetical protein
MLSSLNHQLFVSIRETAKWKWSEWNGYGRPFILRKNRSKFDKLECFIVVTKLVFSFIFSLRFFHMTCRRQVEKMLKSAEMLISQLPETGTRCRRSFWDGAASSVGPFDSDWKLIWAGVCTGKWNMKKNGQSLCHAILCLYGNSECTKTIGSPSFPSQLFPGLTERTIIALTPFSW